MAWGANFNSTPLRAPFLESTLGSRSPTLQSMSTKFIPDGYHTVTPYLTVNNAAAALDFYKRAFGATVSIRMDGPGGKIMHAEFLIEGSPVMMSDEFPEMGALSPETLGGVTSSLMIYLENVDARFEQAVAAGGIVERPVKDQFYGDRSGTLMDPFGHRWTLATHVEDVPPDDLDRRAAAMMSGG
jgi:PhnB protein